MYGCTNTLLTDVTICHPLAPSAKPQHDEYDNTLHTIKDREDSKINKYAELADE